MLGIRYIRPAMKSKQKQPLLQTLRLLSLVAAFAFFCTPAYADVRQDAEAAVARLHKINAAGAFPDDMQNIDLVFEAAGRYFQNNEFEAADSFYLLVLQKTQIIESMITMPESVPPVWPAPVLVPETVPVPLALPEVAGTPSTPDVSAPAESPEIATAEEPRSDRIVGTKGVYTVVKADTIRLVAAKLGVTQQHLRSVNGLDAKAYLKIGQKLAYNNRKIIPQKMRDGIVVNIPDRTLYYFQQGALITSLPVALGSSTKNEKYVWQTPVGKFKVTAKVKDPVWTVPPSIQTEMEEKGKDVITSVPPGPENPLGKYAIKTSIPGILIHSTTKPGSIYSFSSHGCIRVSPDQMEGFFPRIKVNTRGEIIYKPVKLAVADNGRVYLEVHPDVYNRNSNLVAEARQLVEKQQLSELVDWDKLQSVVKQKRGVAEDISL